MNIAIDIGNTQIKIGVFENESLKHHEKLPSSELPDKLVQLCAEYPIRKGILSHVARLDPGHRESLDKQVPMLILDNLTPVPFVNRYATPQTLGVDRIALAAGAAGRFPGQNVLVIDAGSCITFDFVNEQSEYLGGAISPGIQMRYRSVNAFTANLPLLSPADEIPERGDTTDRALHRGILNGVVCEIDGTIDQYRRENSNLTVVLTGGDANFLANNLKSSIFAIPNFLLDGLNRILIYNIEE